jgi:Zn-dependent protease with chaperone function
VSVLAAIQLILLAGVAFALLAGSLASCCAPVLLARTADWSPQSRHRALLLASVAPLLVATFSVGAVLAPSFLALLWPEYDHCLQHGDHHVHLCLTHLPRHLGNAASWLVLSLATAWASLRAGAALAELFRAWRCYCRLRLHGQSDTALGANVLPTGAPLCILAGVFRPILFLSRGLLAAIAPEQLVVILHHERAHASRRDILLRLVARVGSVFMWPSVRASLLAALELAAEQSCDEVAAARVGDRLQVAEAILRVERLLQQSTPALSPLAVAFGGDTVPQRVAALLEAPRRSGSFVLLSIAFACLLCGVLSISVPLHHLTESLLEALVH